MQFRGISITIRLTVLFAAISTAVLLILGLLIGRSVESHFVEQDMELMTGKLHLVSHLLKKIQSTHDLEGLPTLLDDALVGHHDLALQVLHPDRRTLFTSGDARFPALLLNRNAVHAKPRAQIWQQPASPDSAHTQPWRGMTALLPSGIAGLPPLLVAVAVDIHHHEHFMASFRKTLWLFVSLAAVIVSLLGWLMVRHGLAPLQAIRQGAAAVTASRLDYRLAVEAVPVELAELAETLNHMLARLQESFQRLKDFSSDLAHELRTPISTLMTQTQVVLSRARSDEEYREVLASNAEEYERMARMIGDMLFLAQADNGLILLNREEIDLAEQIRELFDFFDALAEEKSLRLSLAGSAQVSGDKLMLRRALANLLSNAIRHSVQGGQIEVCISTADDSTTVSITNQGAAIAPEHLPHLFERFYRADPSRHRNGDGAGLGLAITRAIVQAHSGEIVVRSDANGVCFEISLPR